MRARETHATRRKSISFFRSQSQTLPSNVSIFPNPVHCPAQSGFKHSTFLIDGDHTLPPHQFIVYLILMPQTRLPNRLFHTLPCNDFPRDRYISSYKLPVSPSHKPSCPCSISENPRLSDEMHCHIDTLLLSLLATENSECEFSMP